MDEFDSCPPPPPSPTTLKKRPLKTDASHEIPWLCTLLNKRLYIGPFPSRKEDLDHLVLQLGVTHVFNMCVATDEVNEKTGLNRALWYSCYFNPKRGVDPHVVRSAPVPSDFVLWSETKQIEFYLSAAKQIATLLEQDKYVTIYVHNKTGFAEEAFAAILAWRLFDKQTFPENVQAWLKDKLYERVLDNEDQMAMLKKAVEKSKSMEKQVG